jgi:hypothetical protein
MDNSPQIQFYDQSKGPPVKPYRRLSIFAVVLAFTLVLGSAYYFLVFGPVNVCYNDSRQDTEDYFRVSSKLNSYDQKFSGLANVTDKKLMQAVLLSSCLRGKGFSQRSIYNIGSPLGIIIVIIIEVCVIFVLLLILSSRYESKFILLCRSLLLASFLIIVNSIGSAFGFSTSLVALILNLIAIIFVLGYGFISAVLFALGLEMANYFVVYVIYNALK